MKNKILNSLITFCLLAICFSCEKSSLGNNMKPANATPKPYLKDEKTLNLENNAKYISFAKHYYLNNDLTEDSAKTLLEFLTKYNREIKKYDKKKDISSCINFTNQILENIILNNSDFKKEYLDTQENIIKIIVNKATFMSFPLTKLERNFDNAIRRVCYTSGIFKQITPIFEFIPTDYCISSLNGKNIDPSAKIEEFLVAENYNKKEGVHVFNLTIGENNKFIPASLKLTFINHCNYDNYSLDEENAIYLIKPYSLLDPIFNHIKIKKELFLKYFDKQKEISGIFDENNHEKFLFIPIKCDENTIESCNIMLYKDILKYKYEELVKCKFCDEETALFDLLCVYDNLDCRSKKKKFYKDILEIANDINGKKYRGIQYERIKEEEEKVKKKGEEEEKKGEEEEKIEEKYISKDKKTIDEFNENISKMNFEGTVFDPLTSETIKDKQKRIEELFPRINKESLENFFLQLERIKENLKNIENYGTEQTKCEEILFYILNDFIPSLHQDQGFNKMGKVLYQMCVSLLNLNLILVNVHEGIAYNCPKTVFFNRDFYEPLKLLNYLFPGQIHFLLNTDNFRTNGAIQNILLPLYDLFTASDDVEKITPYDPNFYVACSGNAGCSEDPNFNTPKRLEKSSSLINEFLVNLTVKDDENTNKLKRINNN